MNRRLCLLTLLLLAGCDLPGKPRKQDRPVPQNEVLDFTQLYEQNCAGCHGRSGQLGPALPLNDPLFLAIVPDAVLHDVVASGRPGTPMPAFRIDRTGPLTPAQVKVLADGLKKQWPASKTPDLPPYLAGEVKGDAVRGAKVYGRACASCHGDQGRGGMTTALDGVGTRDVGPIRDQAFLRLVSDQALRRLIITGRSDLGMPDYAGKSGRAADFAPLTSQEIADVVALLAQWRQGSGGK